MDLEDRISSITDGIENAENLLKEVDAEVNKGGSLGFAKQVKVNKDKINEKLDLIYMCLSDAKSSVPDEIRSANSICK
ncbi:MAG: hypothetical protein LBM16_00105, partial [Clostridiales bacterium]|nr:hypothetical protein [Clostridiales bacterium]